MISINNSSIYIGSITITTSVLSTVFGYFLVHNSPIQFLQMSKESEAYKSLAYFQQNTYQNPHIEIETLKAALVVENNRPLAIRKRHNTTSMLIILLLKIGYLAFFNIMFRSIRLTFTASLLTIDSNTNLFRTTIADSLYTIARLVGLVFGVVFITKLSHRCRYVISGLVSGGLIAILGIVLNISRAFTDFNPNYIQWIIFAVFMTAELFFGFGVAMVPDIILAEILPIREKRYSIGILIVVEHIIQIILNVLYIQNVLYQNLEFFMPILSIFTCSAALAAFALLKDTRNKSLLEVANIYKNAFDWNEKNKKEKQLKK